MCKGGVLERSSRFTGCFQCSMLLNRSCTSTPSGWIQQHAGPFDIEWPCTSKNTAFPCPQEHERERVVSMDGYAPKRGNKKGSSCASWASVVRGSFWDRPVSPLLPPEGGEEHGILVFIRWCFDITFAPSPVLRRSTRHTDKGMYRSLQTTWPWQNNMTSGSSQELQRNLH